MKKKTKDLTMNDEFELRGNWWIPGTPECTVGGILNYDSNSINLQLLGCLDDHDDAYKYDIIQGITEEGEPITLCDGFLSKWNQSGIVRTQTFTFNKFILGKHFDSFDEIEFHSLSISYSSLEDWLSFSPFKKSTEHENNKLTKATLSYEFPPTFEAYIKSKKTKIKTGCTFSSSGNLHKSHGYTHKATIDILPDEPMDLEWFFSMSHEIKDFLTLLSNRAIYPKQLKAKGNIINEKYKIRESFTIFSLYYKKTIEKEIKPFEMCINFQMIKEDWENILNHWFTDPSYSSRKIYLQNLYDTEKTWETAYLDYAKALESLHRDTTGEVGQFLPDEVYEPLKNKMIESIQQGDMCKDTFNSLKNKLTSALKYAHHYGFERRIRDTFKGVDAQIKDIIFPNGISQLKTFSSNITTTRDYYTHYGEKPTYYFKDFDLYFVNSKLHIVLFYYFCTRLGINKELISQLLARDHDLLYRLKMKTEQFSKFTKFTNQKADS
ncbi:HEPN domain-containing protein [Bacillus cereus group sp. N3]|uniref:ApeA N-terminal domain 1-containing protein n=1 Tax=Bacillus cereus group sp. N3 TaxID=2794582 RepID=UPI0018F56E7B|nr:HEPN domain-containing protein [Bacillus cereus group sp. N3]MBJ8128900.1 hypothetical protein [Bacillus cereus group sp. N3]